MYRDVDFAAEDISQIAGDIAEARAALPYVRRVFLENGDAFCLPGEDLEKIASMINEAFPEVQVISMYASIRNIADKTDEELRRLHDLKVGDLNIGVESGSDEALQFLNKGYDSGEALRQLLRLKSAGISYGLNVIFGCLGHGRSAELAKDTAELINKTNPFLIFTGTIHADPGCELYEDMTAGRFEECTVGEYLDEEIEFLENLDSPGTFYFGLHPANVIPVQGMLPEDQERILGELKAGKSQKSLAELNAHPVRGSEGAIYR